MEVFENGDDMKYVHMDKENCSLNGEQKLIYKETTMLKSNLCHFTCSRKMIKVEVCLATFPGKQPRQDKGHWLHVLCSQCP